MASYKQELIQLHQLLTEIRLYTKDEWGEPTEIENLDAYNDTGLTSINIDAEVDKQKESILALTSGLTTLFEIPEPPSEKKSISTDKPTGPTENQTFFDLEEGTTETVQEKSQTATSTATTIKPVTEPSNTKTARASNGEESASDGKKTPDLMETELQHEWSAAKLKQERKPIETWQADPQEYDEQEQQEPAATVADNIDDDQTRLAVDVETKAEEQPTGKDSTTEPVTSPTP